MAREREGLAAQERAEIETLLASIRKLPPDSKVEKLKKVLADLRSDGYPQVMVFTQYTDTMDFIREELASDKICVPCAFPAAVVRCAIQTGLGARFRATTSSDDSKKERPTCFFAPTRLPKDSTFSFAAHS